MSRTPHKRRVNYCKMSIERPACKLSVLTVTSVFYPATRTLKYYRLTPPIRPFFENHRIQATAFRAYGFSLRIHEILFEYLTRRPVFQLSSPALFASPPPGIGCCLNLRSTVTLFLMPAALGECLTPARIQHLLRDSGCPRNYILRRKRDSVKRSFSDRK